MASDPGVTPREPSRAAAGDAAIVRLVGELICRDDTEAATVAAHLGRHIELTRAEPGCVSFEVEPTGSPLVWTVRETFVDARAFAAHQERTSAGEWGRATAGIERRYVIDGLER